jgi:hypothetical protein
VRIRVKNGRSTGISCFKLKIKRIALHCMDDLEDKWDFEVVLRIIGRSCINNDSEIRMVKNKQRVWKGNFLLV